MKIRVNNNRYDYMGLAPGSYHNVERVVVNEFGEKEYYFTHLGRKWALTANDCDELVKLEELWGGEPNEKLMDVINTDLKKEEYTGKSVDYYKVKVDNPTTESNTPYLAECNDLIEALGMNYAEGNAFKAIWRKCAARKFGVKKKGYDNGLYDSEKVVFFGERMVEQSKEQK